MSGVELRSAWWFTTQRATVYAAGDYHARHLAAVLSKLRRRRADPRPPAPRHLEWEYGLQKHTLTLDQKQRQQQQTEEWVKSSEAWLKRGGRDRAPRPPRQGFVVTCWHRPKLSFYEVRGRAREALARLCEVAAAAGGTGTSRLRYCVEEYAELQRRNRHSWGEMTRAQRPLQEARAAMEKASRDLAAAKAAHDTAAIARAEYDRAEARTRLAPINSRLVRAHPEEELALASLCLAAEGEFAVQAKVVSFVSRFGPLLLDFGAWCADSEYGAFVSRHPGSSPDLSSHLLQLGHERFLWPERWRKWATGCYERSECMLPVHPIPPPVGFYVWAAYMLLALQEHPEWPGCQLFFANRLASLRLVSDEMWFPELAQAIMPHRGRRPSAWLHGELLDYLALFAASPSVSAPAGSPHTIRCRCCGKSLDTYDGRRSYCDAHSNRRSYSRVAQRSFRQRYRSWHPKKRRSNQ